MMVEYRLLLFLAIGHVLNFMLNTAVIGEYKVMDILAICQNLKILLHFEILTLESMGKPTM